MASGVKQKRTGEKKRRGRIGEQGLKRKSLLFLCPSFMGVALLFQALPKGDPVRNLNSFHSAPPRCAIFSASLYRCGLLFGGE